MRVTRKIPSSKHDKLKSTLDSRFDEPTVNDSGGSVYKGEIKLNVNLRFETSMSFPIELALIHSRKITTVEARLSLLKISVIAGIVFLGIATLFFFLKSIGFAISMGVIFGLFTYLIGRFQSTKGVRSYLKHLIN